MHRAKLSYRWQPATVGRWAVSGGKLLRDEETGDPFRVPCCPACMEQVLDNDGVPLTREELSRRRHACAGCGSALWQADASGPRRYPLADYVKHRMKGFFGLLIGDEVHEYKGRGSAQGIAAGVLADACSRSLTLTGTLLGGYSSTLFHLLYRFSPAIRSEFGRAEEGRWIARYGFTEHTVGGTTATRWRTAASAGAGSTGRSSGSAPGSRPRRCSTSSATPSSPPRRRRIRLLPARGLRRGIPSPAGRAGRRAREGLEAAPRRLPPGAAGLPRRLHPRRDRP